MVPFTAYITVYTGEEKKRPELGSGKDFPLFLRSQTNLQNNRIPGKPGLEEILLDQTQTDPRDTSQLASRQEQQLANSNAVRQEHKENVSLHTGRQ
jgi:hypothetical protein